MDRYGSKLDYIQNALVCNEILTFVSFILSLIFQSKVTAICLIILSQGANKKEIQFIYGKKDSFTDLRLLETELC